MASESTEIMKRIDFLQPILSFFKVIPLKNSDSLRIVYGWWNRLQNRIVKEYTK